MTEIPIRILAAVLHAGIHEVGLGTVHGDEVEWRMSLRALGLYLWVPEAAWAASYCEKPSEAGAAAVFPPPFATLPPSPPEDFSSTATPARAILLNSYWGSQRQYYLAPRGEGRGEGTKMMRFRL